MCNGVGLEWWWWWWLEGGGGRVGEVVAIDNAHREICGLKWFYVNMISLQFSSTLFSYLSLLINVVTEMEMLSNHYECPCSMVYLFTSDKNEAL